MVNYYHVSMFQLSSWDRNYNDRWRTASLLCKGFCFPSGIIKVCSNNVPEAPYSPQLGWLKYMHRYVHDTRGPVFHNCAVLVQPHVKLKRTYIVLLFTYPLVSFLLSKIYKHYLHDSKVLANCYCYCYIVTQSLPTWPIILPCHLVCTTKPTEIPLH